MIGLDTNVLLRFFVVDDEGQQAKVAGLLRRIRNEGQTAYVSVLVLCETAWVLSETFGYSKAELLEAIERLLDVDVFRLEDEDTVRAAIETCRGAAGGFTDHLIGHRNREAGCSSTMTFDRKLGRVSVFSRM